MEGRYTDGIKNYNQHVSNLKICPILNFPNFRALCDQVFANGGSRLADPKMKTFSL